MTGIRVLRAQGLSAGMQFLGSECGVPCIETVQGVDSTGDHLLVLCESGRCYRVHADLLIAEVG